MTSPSSANTINKRSSFFTDSTVSRSLLQSSSNHQSLLQTQIFNKLNEHVLAFLSVSAANTVSSSTPSLSASNLETLSTITLVLTLNTNSSPQPKIHWLKNKTSTTFTYKKYKLLKSLRKIDLISNNIDRIFSFTLLPDNKIYYWRPIQPELRNTFIWFLIETSKYYCNFIPPTNIDKIVYDTLTSEILIAYTNTSTKQLESNSSQKALISLVNKSRTSADELANITQGNQIENIVLPPISPEDTANILYFLKESKLDISRINELESKLQSQLTQIESDNIDSLFDSNNISATSGMLEKMDIIGEKLDEMSMWMGFHDAELKRMRMGIERIEARNTRLELLEHNHSELHNILRKLIDDLTLQPDVIKILEKPDFKNNLQQAILAADLLDSASNIELADSLMNLAAVQQQMKQYSTLKSKFATEANKSFETIFNDIYKKQTAEIEKYNEKNENSARIETCEVIHTSLLVYSKLNKYVAKFDIAIYNQLKPKYLNSFSKVYETKLKAFFHNLKKLITIEKKDSSWSTLPDYNISTSGVNSINNNNNSSKADIIKKGHQKQVSVSLSTQGHSTILQGKQSITEVWKNALQSILPLCQTEEKFLSKFFTMADGSNNNNNNNSNNPISSSNAGEIKRMMGVLFAGLEPDLLELCSIGEKQDKFNVLEMLVHLEESMQSNESKESKENPNISNNAINSEYLSGILTSIQAHLKLLWNNYIDEQLKWLESLKINPKRCGILSPIAKFPNLVGRIESIVNSSHDNNLRSSAADTSYHKLLIKLFSWLDSIAKSDDKYTSIVYMENHEFFFNSFKSFPILVPTLLQSISKSESKYKENLSLYCEWNIEYELTILTKFWSKLMDQLKQTKPNEIQFTAELSKNDLRTITKTALNQKNLHKSLLNIYKRVQKHLGNNNKLIQLVWISIQRIFIAKLKQFEKIVNECYINEKIGISLEEVQTVFQSIDSTGSNNTGNITPRLTIDTDREISVSRSEMKIPLSTTTTKR